MQRTPPEWPVAKRFAEAITGRDNPRLTFQVFDDTGENKELAAWRYGTLAECSKWLVRKTKAGCGVYFTINQCDGNGRKGQNVLRATASAVDFDGRKLPKTWAIQPDLIIESSPGRFHVYWLIEPTDDLNAWSDCQARLAAYYGGDPKIFDAPRVLRLPGFDHLKRDPFRVRVLQWPDTDAMAFGRRTLDDMAQAHPCDYEKPRERDGKDDRRAVVDLDGDPAIERGREYLESAPVSVEGEGGNNNAFNVFCRLSDFGLSAEMSVELATEGDDSWNDRCLPPWSDEELSRIAKNAAKYRHDPPGFDNPEAIEEEFGEYVEEDEQPRQKEKKDKKKRPRFQGMNIVELRALPPLEYLVEGLVPVRQLFEIYGPRKSGKTFLSIDLGLHVATGRTWHGRAVRKGRILHIVGEGNIGAVRNRVDAWIQHYSRDPKTGQENPEIRAQLEADIAANWVLVGRPVHVDKPEIFREFVASNPGNFAGIIIDTVFRNMAGDILDASDSQKFIAACDAIRDKMGAAVIIVHHEGKDATRGSFGSTVIEAAVDGAVKFYRPGMGSTKRRLEIALLRDASDDLPALVFDFVAEELPRDQRSAVLKLIGTEEDDEETTVLGADARVRMDALLRTFENAPDLHNEERGQLFKPVVSRETIRKAKKKLIDAGYLDNNTGSLTDKGRDFLENKSADKIEE